MQNLDLNAEFKLLDLLGNLPAGVAGLAGAVDDNQFALNDFEYGIGLHLVGVFAGVEIP